MRKYCFIGICWTLALVLPGCPAFAQTMDGTDKERSGPAFILRSPAVDDGGQLPVDYTGDGTSSTLPLEWSGAPAGTKSLALIMHHIAPDKAKWYWIIYNIPAQTRRLPKNVKGVGVLGNNSVNGRQEYAPPHSKGPGPKKYIYTLYALSAKPMIGVKPGEVNREVLLSAMKGRILGRAELSVFYERFTNAENGGGTGNDEPRPAPGEGEDGGATF